MNNFFDSIKRRFEKVSDIYTEEDKGKLLIQRDVALAIIEDEKDWYNNHLWNPLWRKIFPKSNYGESSRPVLVRYKDMAADPEVCTYIFSTNKFMCRDKDVTGIVKEWCEIPGYWYDD